MQDDGIPKTIFFSDGFRWFDQESVTISIANRTTRRVIYGPTKLPAFNFMAFAADSDATVIRLDDRMFTNIARVEEWLVPGALAPRKLARIEIAGLMEVIKKMLYDQIQKVLDRGEPIEVIVDKTPHLEQRSISFKDKPKDPEKECSIQ